MLVRLGSQAVKRTLGCGGKRNPFVPWHGFKVDRNRLAQRLGIVKVQWPVKHQQAEVVDGDVCECFHCEMHEVRE